MKNPKVKFSLKLTTYYFILGVLLLIFFHSTILGSISEIGNLLELRVIGLLAFLILTAIIFYFLVYLSIKRSDQYEEVSSPLSKSLEQSSFIITITDDKGVLRFVNPRFTRISGYKSNDVIGKNLSEFAEMKSEDFFRILEDLRSGKERSSELCFKKMNGLKFWELASFVSVFNPESKTNDFVKISLDITDMKSNAIELSKAKEKAEVMNNVKTQFLANMSQEIRTPMSGIIGMTELMFLTSLSKEQKEYLEIINFSSSTLLAIINDILDFSRIETGKLKLENIEFNIRDLVYKTCQILDFDARKKKLALKLNIQDKIKYNIVGDPLRINQIIINLLKNSIKYTEKGTVELNLTETKKEDEKVKLLFEVRDTGVGLPKETIDNLYENISSADYSPDIEYKGTGLGLAIVKHLVRMMSGELIAKSSEGSGSVVSFEIPFEKAKPLEKTAKIAKEKRAGIKKEGVVNILVAEDNVVNQRLVKELLIRKNYNVVIVENGLKIFDAMEEGKFDIVLMDVQMPVMDGLEATSIIREIEKGTGKHTPIIGITAYSVKADREKCVDAGMDDYLSKPFVKEEFYKLIEKYLKK
ncbi:MAG: response regulator [Ignavibacteria bacterium]|nr:response regulator [Ignavibacteria bacterium]